MTPTQVVNLALSEIGQQTQVASVNPSDGTPAGNVAAIMYTPKLQMLLRSAPWVFARRQVSLTLLKATVINGVVQTTNLPPSPFQYEYAYPSDCIKARFLVPTPQSNSPALTTGPQTPSYYNSVTSIPYVVANDVDSSNNPIKVILTNLQNAQLVYTVDLSQSPDMWDSLFLAGSTALLGSYFINALARNERQLESQIAIAKGVLDSARAMNGNESLVSMDHTPDWMRVRSSGWSPWGSGANVGLAGYDNWTGWDTCQMANGLWY